MESPPSVFCGPLHSRRWFLLSSDPVQNHIGEPRRFLSICFTSRNKLLKRTNIFKTQNRMEQFLLESACFLLLAACLCLLESESILFALCDYILRVIIILSKSAFSPFSVMCLSHFSASSLPVCCMSLLRPFFSPHPVGPFHVVLTGFCWQLHCCK